MWAGRLVAALAVGLAGVAGAGAQEGPAAEAYAWAPACKACHAAIYEAWEDSKHARAINRLTEAERQRECVRCHITVGTALLDQEGALVNANVQCEACHGPGQAHVATAGDAGGRVRLVARPDAASCQTCHNDTSPHYRGFFYSAMAPFVHRAPR